jgi:glycine cleavage system aminomethyltransferase T
VATTFGKKKQALQALQTGVVLVDQSHWGRLRVAGDDRLALLHNQSTADFKAMAPGQGTDTVRGAAGSVGLGTGGGRRAVGVRRRLLLRQH